MRLKTIVLDIRSGLAEFLRQNVISKKELHSLIGKLNHATGPHITMRPFLEPLWAALYSEDNGGAPKKTIWTNQVAVFSEFSPSLIERFFKLDAYQRASPCGMGGWLTIDAKLTHFFSCPVT